MKIKQGFILRQLGKQFIAVPLDQQMQEFQGMIRLNETAAKMWGFLLETDRSKEELVVFLMESYGISQKEAEKDSQEFLTILRNHHLLSDD